MRFTDVVAAALGASFDGRERAAGDLVPRARAAVLLFGKFGDASLRRPLRLGGRFGSGLPCQQVQKAHLRDDHLDGWRLIRRCGKALGGKPGGGRAKAGEIGVRRALRRGSRETTRWRIGAREHLVQDGAEGGYIGARIGVPYEAVRGKQRRPRRAQHDGSQGYCAVRLTGTVQLAENSGHIRSATQGEG